MTGAAADKGRFSGVVRPLASQVVRKEWAARAAAPMMDALGAGEQRRPDAVPAAAYENAPPALYVYRMRDRSGDHVGVVADVRLDAFAAGVVRGHESVEPQRVDALVRYYAGLPAHSEPVALLHDHRASATRRVEDACRGDPLLQFQGQDDVEHTVWRVTGDEVTTELTAALGDGVHYIADGHHRVAARLRAWEGAGRPAGAGVLCVVFPVDGLRVSAFHRRVLGPVDGDALLGAAAAHFRVRTVPAAPRTNAPGVYVAGRWYEMKPASARREGSAGLDVSVLQARLLGPVLGIPGPGHPRLEVVPDHVPLQHLTAMCDEDRGALFVLRPPSLEAITRIADLGEVLPPKTTYFAPKPYAGIFLT